MIHESSDKAVEPYGDDFMIPHTPADYPAGSNLEVAFVLGSRDYREMWIEVRSNPKAPNKRVAPSFETRGEVLAWQTGAGAMGEMYAGASPAVEDEA